MSTCTQTHRHTKLKTGLSTSASILLIRSHTSIPKNRNLSVEPRDQNKPASNSFSRRLGACSSQLQPQNQTATAQENLFPIPAGVGRVLRVGGATPRCVGGSLGGLRGELAKGRWGILSTAGEICILGAGSAIARGAPHSSACWIGSCVRGRPSAGFSLKKSGARKKDQA